MSARGVTESTVHSASSALDDLSGAHPTARCAVPAIARSGGELVHSRSAFSAPSVVIFKIPFTARVGLRSFSPTGHRPDDEQWLFAGRHRRGQGRDRVMSVRNGVLPGSRLLD